MISTLPRVVPAAEGKPVRAGAAHNQRLVASVAASPLAWTGEAARAMAGRFDELAPTWDAERAGYRPAPLADALARGGPWPAGRCVEVGAGTGVLTPLLTAVWPELVALDLSPAMLARCRHPWRVRADAARLPLPAGSLAAVVVGDAPLFAAEYARVLAPEGVLVWVNALGTGAPFHLPTRAIVDALAAATGAGWDAVQSEAAWGSWAVLRRGRGVPV